MNDVIYLCNVAPGPACSIPEEKKIFRVTGEDAAAVTRDVRLSADQDGALECQPWPIPHMYSA